MCDPATDEPAAEHTGRRLLLRLVGLAIVLALSALAVRATAPRSVPAGASLIARGTTRPLRFAPAAATPSPTSNAISPDWLLRRDRVVYLVGSEAQARRVRGAMSAANSPALPADTVVVVAATAEQESALRQGITLDNADRALDGLPAVKLVDLR